MATKKLQVLGDFPGGDGGAVRYTEQTLTEEQQAQVRENISVPSNAEVFEQTSKLTFTNALETAGIEYGKALNAGDGSVTDTDSPYATTGFIKISMGQTVRVNEDFPLACIPDLTMPKVVVYDSTFARVGGSTSFITMQNSSYYFEILEKNADGHIIAFKVLKPSATAYIRICNHTSLIGANPVLTIDEEIKYEMSYGDKLNPNVEVDYSQITNVPQKNGWNILPYERLNIAYSSIGRKPINTVEHFTDAATNFGYNVLKCDVQPTADGELVCCHDAGFTFDGNGKITTYDASNSTAIHDVTAETVLGYSHPSGEHPCLVGDYLDVCHTYGKVAFITIRSAYMDVVIPKLLEELRIHNMTYSTIINSLSYDSLVLWRKQDQSVMVNYTLGQNAKIDQTQIDRAVRLGYSSMCGFYLNSASFDLAESCDFEYARAKGIRILQAIAYQEGYPELCYENGYDGCQIGFPWNPKMEAHKTADGDINAESHKVVNVANGTADGDAVNYGQLSTKVDKVKYVPEGTDLNAVTTSGFYRLNGSAMTNTPGANKYEWSPMIVCAGGDTCTQIITRWDTGEMSIRSGSTNEANASWIGNKAWKTVLNSENWGQHISVSDDGTISGAVREFNSGAIDVTEYTTPGAASKFYNVTTKWNGISHTETVDWMSVREASGGLLTLQYCIKYGESEVWINLHARILKDNKVLFSVSQGTIAHVCGYY